jgi:hypothetical protein
MFSRILLPVAAVCDRRRPPAKPQVTSISKNCATLPHKRIPVQLKISVNDIAAQPGKQTQTLLRQKPMPRGFILMGNHRGG